MATLRKGRLNRTRLLPPPNVSFGNTWVESPMTYPDGKTSVNANLLWTDGKNVFWSYKEGTQYVLIGDTWEPKTWYGYQPSAYDIWTDGTNIYSNGGSAAYSYVLNGDTWEPKTWYGYLSGSWGYGYGDRQDVSTYINGDNVWTDGKNIYMSNWLARNYAYGEMALRDGEWYYTSLGADIYGSDTWSDGTNVYCEHYDSDAKVNNHYVLDNGSWKTKTWNIDADSYYIWTDGTSVYHSKKGNGHYVLIGETWEPMVWKGVTDFSGSDVWCDGTNIHLDSDGKHYVLAKATPVPQLNPAALMQSFFVGEAVKRCRR